MSNAEKSPQEETEDAETEMEEAYNPDDKDAENIPQESKEDDSLAWRDSQEEREEVAGVLGETTVRPQEITTSSINLEGLTLVDSQTVMSETFPEIHDDGESEHSSQSESSNILSSQLQSLDLDLTISEEQLVSSIERQSLGELEEKTNQMPQKEVDQERREPEPENGERSQEKGVSDFIIEKEKESLPEAGILKDSLVSTTTEDVLFHRGDSATVYPLTMTRSFGWNSSLPVYYIRDENQRVLLYASSHTAVIHNILQNHQHHLQGHPNVISCLSISDDRRWVATADKGPNCLIIIWDSFTGIPVHTIFDSCPEGNGIRAIAITQDAKYLATISDAEIQKVCIWRWTLAAETPACCLNLPKEYGFQNYLTFNPTNNKELVSNSKTQAIYYFWYEEGDVLTHSAPLLTEKTFNKFVGKFSQSIFHLNLTQMLSATMEGKLVVWNIHHPPPSASASLGLPYIKPCKLVHLQKEGITVLTAVDGYIVTGDMKGNIKFYDHTLSIVSWYSHFKLSPIRTLSFSKAPATPPTKKSNYPPDCTLKGDLFVVRNFIIGTSDATVYHLTANETKLEKLLVEPKGAVCALSCHPYQPLIAIGSFCGMIKVWDYEKKTYLFSRVFEKGLGVQSLTYNPEGVLLGVGFTEGTVYILDAMSLESEIPEPFKYSRANVTHISFSHDSKYMATAIEYNLLESYKDHLAVLDIHRTDQGNYPTCMIWYPPLTKEHFLLISNTGYKVKLFNSTTKMCRKTLLGPVYGSPMEQVQILPVKTAIELQKRCLVFINRDKVGLQILPIDGNPHKTSAVVCHPNGVAGMALSYDGRYVFTAGGKDRSVVQWEVNVSALEAAASLGGEGLTPFYGLVSGGREGKFYRELEDYFYYSQLRSQGIDTMKTREVSEHICLSELPFVMRAIGFYPSEEKIEDMFNEVKFGKYVDTGEITDKINLPDFLKVYLNHRPPFGNTMKDIQKSFDVLGYTNSKGEKVIQREDFLKLLLTKGEHMTEGEMSDCFASLLGLSPEGRKSEPSAAFVKGSEMHFKEELPDEITAEIFATEILGFTISPDSRQNSTVSEAERNV